MSNGKTKNMDKGDFIIGYDSSQPWITLTDHALNSCGCCIGNEDDERANTISPVGKRTSLVLKEKEKKLQDQKGNDMNP